jgi:NAD(P)-dependent dehydrogenase (short-subunit alcohol dehydrogenase family)
VVAVATHRTALITGANRGIGHEVARELAKAGMRVVVTGRDLASAEKAAAELRRAGGDAAALELDVADRAAVEACAARLRGQGERVDVLVNNAGVYEGDPVLSAPPEALQRTFDTNFWGAVWTCRAWMPGMIERGYGRVVNVSSGAGSFAEGLEGPAAYAISKAALNALTVRLAREASGDVKVNAVCPGWVRTRMGGSGAPRSVEQGAAGIVWLATLDGDGPTGGFFRDRRPISW